MDDKEGGPKRLQQAILQLKMMDPLKQNEWLRICEIELNDADSEKVDEYLKFLEAAKYV